MAGVNWPKRGEHWSRGEFKTELSADESQMLFIAAHKLTRYAISKNGVLTLIRSVAMAKHEYEKAQQITATRNDTLRSLRAMLAMDDASLLDARSKCDRQTFIEIQIAQNLIPLEEIDWVQSEESSSDVYGPRAMRRSVQDAFDAATKTQVQRGPKSMPYQIELARTCLLIWLECRLPRGAPGRLKFAQAAFEAAGMVLGDKRIGALLSKVGKSETRRSN